MNTNETTGLEADTAVANQVDALVSFKQSETPVAALFVETDGVYFDIPGVDPWDAVRDARRYRGILPVVAHPPCQRWGRYWHGAPNKPNQYRLGEDGGCFAAALTAALNYGGVLEHPAHSKAWDYFGLNRPKAGNGWTKADGFGGWTCQVEQGHYGHMSRKITWLYAVGTERPELNWSKGEQRLHPVALEKYGYEKARRIGMMAMIGGKDKIKIRNATPEGFRNVLLSIAASVQMKLTFESLSGISGATFANAKVVTLIPVRVHSLVRQLTLPV